MTISSESSQKIKNMSLFCAAFVCSIHIGLSYELESSVWFVNRFLRGIANTAVPFFFIISGFFLAGHFNENGWWLREVKKRIISLGVPFYFWSSVWAIIVLSLVPLTQICDLIRLNEFGNVLHIIKETNWIHLFKTNPSVLNCK